MSRDTLQALLVNQIGTSKKSGIAETQYLYSLPERPKLRSLLANQKDKGSLQKTHWRSSTSCRKVWWLDNGWKGRSSSPAPNSKANTDGEGEKSSKTSPYHDKKWKKPSCKFWHPLVCQNYKYEIGCKYGRKCFFRHVEAEERPSKKSKKGGAKGSVALLKESTQLGCVSQDSYPICSTLREDGKFGSKRAVKFSKGTWHQITVRARKGPSRGTIPNCEPQERSPCAPKFGEKITWGDLETRKMRPQSSAGFGGNTFTSSRMRTKVRFTLLLKQG